MQVGDRDHVGDRAMTIPERIAAMDERRVLASVGAAWMIQNVRDLGWKLIAHEVTL